MSLKWSTSSIGVAGERKAWEETWVLLEELRETLGDGMDDLKMEGLLWGGFSLTFTVSRTYSLYNRWVPPFLVPEMFGELSMTIITLHEANSSPLKIDLPKTEISFSNHRFSGGGSCWFQGVYTWWFGWCYAWYYGCGQDVSLIMLDRKCWWWIIRAESAWKLLIVTSHY